MLKILGWIIIGYFNLFLSKIRMLNKQKKLLYDKRYSICMQCQFLNNIHQCSICGCFISAKTKVDNEKCPNNFW